MPDLPITLASLNALMHKITLVPDSANIPTASDTTNRLTVVAWQQSNGSENSYGDGIRLIAEHGRTKLGLKFYARGNSAKVVSAKTAPFNVTAGQTLIISVDGGANQTITFNSGSITSGAATADQIADRISAFLNGAQAINLIADNENKIQISSDTFGDDSTIQIKGGTANTGLGFSTSLKHGADGVDLGDGQTGLQKGWIVCHDKPNDLNSANRHGHMSFEVPDSTGEMQTRLGIEYDLDTTRITVSSSQFIVNGNAVIAAADPGSSKEYWFASDNSGQQKSRLWLHRVDGTGDQDWKLIAVKDDGNTDTLMTGKRLLSTIWMASGLQFKKGADVTCQITLNPLTSGGNSFTVKGTGTVSYMKDDTYQEGARVLLRLNAGQVFTHNGNSPSTGALPFYLKGAADFVVPQEGGYIELHNTGTYWEEIYRTTFDGGPLKSGVATLSAGKKTVNTSAIKTGDRIRLTVQPGGTYAGNIRVSAIVNQTSFTILSSSNTDTCNVFWEIVN